MKFQLVEKKMFVLAALISIFMLIVDSVIPCSQIWKNLFVVTNQYPDTAVPLRAMKYVVLIRHFIISLQCLSIN